MAFIRVGNRIINVDAVESVTRETDGRVLIEITGFDRGFWFVGTEAELVWNHFTTAANDLTALAEQQAKAQARSEAITAAGTAKYGECPF